MNWMALSVSTVWISYGIALITCIRKSDAEVLPVFVTSCVTANLLVRSIAT